MATSSTPASNGSSKSGRIAHRPTPPPKPAPGDSIAVISPSFAAPEHYPELHERALERLAASTGLVPVEYSSTRRATSARQRADDLNHALADPSIRAVITTIGGEDQITIVPFLDAACALADPKPVLGYSDCTNILNWLWTNGIAAFHGGSTQVQMGPGPALDPCHEVSLRAALLSGGRLEIVEPTESEDVGVPWDDPRALRQFGPRSPTEPWTWGGAERTVTGPTWGGSLEVLQWILAAGRFPSNPVVLEGAVLILETSELLISTQEFTWMLRVFGERGLLSAAAAVIVARPPTSNFEHTPSESDRRTHRLEQASAAVDVVARYNSDAVVCAGPSIGHTRPQWIVPYGGLMTVDGAARRVWADYS
ncbi:MAG: S66 peptidase family protein [Actinomycetota bacterium]